MDRIFKFLKFGKKGVIVTIILTFLLSICLGCFSSINSNFVGRASNLYAMARTISTSDDSYCYSHFFTSDKDYQSSKAELQRIDGQFDLMTRKGCVAYLSSSNEDGAKSNYSVNIDEHILNYSIGVITINYLCYDLRSNGCYHGIPFKPYFDSSYFKEKNISCDINYDFGKVRNGGSYITDVFANQLLSYFGLNNYESLLGRTYVITKNDISRTYTINNIILTSQEAAKSVFDSFGDFIVTNDSDVFGSGNCSIYLGVSADVFLCYDLMNYFEKSEHNLLSLKLKENGNWSETTLLLNIKNDIMTKRKWTFNILEFILLVLSFICLIVSCLSFLWLTKHNKPSLKQLCIIDSSILVFLLICNFLFLFFPKATTLLRVINIFVLTPFEVSLFFLLYFIVRSIKERKSEN